MREKERKGEKPNAQHFSGWKWNGGMGQTIISSTTISKVNQTTTIVSYPHDVIIIQLLNINIHMENDLCC
eukprot:m.215328 g.215328  ORF g.215328 m.215328 type:complete len:70 (+) comp13799_c3_seq3:822-1031(+)